jgi:hypothetical protein
VRPPPDALPSAIATLLSAIATLLSAIATLLNAIATLLSAIATLLSAIATLPSAIRPHGALDRGWVCCDRGWECCDRGWVCCDRGWECCDRGWECCDRGWECCDRGWVFCDRGWVCCDRGWECDRPPRRGRSAGAPPRKPPRLRSCGGSGQRLMISYKTGLGRGSPMLAHIDTFEPRRHRSCLRLCTVVKRAFPAKRWPVEGHTLTVACPPGRRSGCVLTADRASDHTRRRAAPPREPGAVWCATNDCTVATSFTEQGASPR